jgi:hypothetical protein
MGDLIGAAELTFRPGVCAANLRIVYRGGIHAMSTWRTIHSFRRGSIDTRRLELAAAALGWVAVFALISALIADAFR